MVRRIALLAGAALAVAATSPRAQPVADWAHAGGSLFAGVSLADPTPEALQRDDRADGGAATVILAPEQPYAAAIEAAALRHGLDAKLLHALVTVESAYDEGAVSAAGAGGLTQLMPATAAELGVADRFDPLANLQGGAAYLARQVARFGDLRLALAAYNAGPSRVARLGRVPAIPETELYVREVVDCYLALAAGRAVRRARQCRPVGGGDE